ncbi:MAG: YaaC family protein [Candidatus Daviesbacteria bacterium]|nr:YaaC family protein [Candidatus Daviesbacteria bacterium]
MTAFRNGEYRKVTGYLRQHLNTRNIQGLSTSGSVDDELWILLEYYSEVEDVGLKFLLDNGIKNKTTRKTTYKHFQAYVRQAKNYYNSAKVLAPRSAGLLYYYCFLNLAKAALVVRDPSIGGKKITHGLSYKINSDPHFIKQSVNILNDGVFPKLYALYFGQSVKQMSLTIPALLNYCTDIGYQCQMAGIHQTKIIYSYYAHCVDKTKKTGWGLVAIPQASLLLKYHKSIKSFIDTFEKIELPQLSCRELFDLDAFQQSHYSFFQSREEKKWISDNIPSEPEVRSETLAALSRVFQTYYFAKGADFAISLPYLPNKQVRMDETIAIYLIMFYLSNLVRYNPRYLEGLLSKKESWLIDSFVRSCSVTFLRAFISRIIGTDYIIEAR